MANEHQIVNAYVESINDDPHSENPRLLVTFRLEWPSRAISPTYRVSVKSTYENAVQAAWKTVVEFFEEIRAPDKIRLKRAEPMTGEN